MNLSHYFVLMFLFAVIVFILVSREERKREAETKQGHPPACNSSSGTPSAADPPDAGKEKEHDG